MAKGKNKKIRGNSFRTLYLLCAVIVLIALSFFNLALYFTSKKTSETSEVLSSQKSVAGQVSYWKGLLKANPQYLDGWLELAQIEYALGNLETARQYLLQAKEIDPNSKYLKEVTKELGF